MNHSPPQADPSASVSGIELQSLPFPSDILRDSHPETKSQEELTSIRDDPTPPATAVEARQRWNEPRSNMWRVFATYYSFFVFGMNDGAYGALVPYLEEFYGLDYTVVSLVFLSPFAGYTMAAMLNSTLRKSLVPTINAIPRNVYRGHLLRSRLMIPRCQIRPTGYRGHWSWAPPPCFHCVRRAPTLSCSRRLFRRRRIWQRPHRRRLVCLAGQHGESQ